MTVRRIGEVSLTSIVPLLADFEAALALSLGIATPELEAKLAGLANVLLSITVAPPQLGATITAALATIASLQASIGGPVVTLQAAAIAELIVELSTSLAQLTAAAALSVPNATLSLYVFEGDAAVFGSELQSAIDTTLPGPRTNCRAIVIATTDTAAWAAAQLVFRT